MLELFVMILCIAAAWLVAFGVREVTNMAFQYTADVGKTFEDQVTSVKVIHRINMVSHYTMIYLKASGAVLFAVWLMWLAIVIR
nr:MAG: hypothetical protein [Bacteriophage sp.]